MRFPTWVYGLLALAWTAFVSYNYLCVKCGCCSTPTPTLPAKLSGPLDYRWGNSEAISGTGFDAYKAGIIAKGGQGDTLVITGLYRAEEKNTTKFENLGVARAESAKLLFVDKIGASRIICTSKLVTDDMNQTDLHSSASFDWTKAVINMKEASIIESGNEISILFPTGSAAKTANVKVDTYLAELIKKHKGTSSNFLITGHTDNKGKEEANNALGLNRANSIRRVLVDGGIVRENIKVDSKGSLEPVATNDTEEGRYQNRRVVLKITQ